MPDLPFPVLYDELVTKELFREWKDGDLRQRWAAAYPDLFDEADLAIDQPTKFFVEWYAAILLKEKEGLLSLIGKYGHHGYKKHTRKQDVLRQCLTREQHQYIITAPVKLFGTRKGISGWPDLFVYRPDFTEFFFCEVKGPTDKIRASQVTVFNRLHERTRIPIRLFLFHYARSVRRRTPAGGKIGEGEEW